MPSDKSDSSLKKPLLIALIVMVLLLAAWHVVLPLLGVVAVMSAAAWGVMMGSIVLVAVAVLLFFVFSGFWIFVIGGLAIVWLILAVSIFPFIFPMLIPLLILLVFVAFVRRKKDRS